MKEEIVVLLGSKSDTKILEPGFSLMEELGIDYTLAIISAHRHPEKLRKFCKELEKKQAKVIIACAGRAAALPGFVASYVDIPVIGVALKGGLLDGLDALLSMVSSPKGLGLVCSGVGMSAFINALIVALEILSLKDRALRKKVEKVKNKFR